MDPLDALEKCRMAGRAVEDEREPWWKWYIDTHGHLCRRLGMIWVVYPQYTIVRGADV
jgi:hypothetical protein